VTAVEEQTHLYPVRLHRPEVSLTTWLLRRLAAWRRGWVRQRVMRWLVMQLTSGKIVPGLDAGKVRGGHHVGLIGAQAITPWDGIVLRKNLLIKNPLPINQLQF